MKSSLARFCYVVAALAMLGYAYFTLQGPRGLRALMEKRTSIAQLEQTNTKLTRENEQKLDYIHRLDKDPKVQENVIREQMKLVHPDEKVFITGAPPQAK
jgi:cell division protein FtsB